MINENMFPKIIFHNTFSILKVKVQKCFYKFNSAPKSKKLQYIKIFIFIFSSPNHETNVKLTLLFPNHLKRNMQML